MMFRLAWGALAARKLRAILTIMGIVIGPALIVGLVGATQGFQASAEERFNNMGLNTLFVSRNFRGGLSIDQRVVNEIQEISGVALAVPYYQITGSVRVQGESPSVRVLALDLSKLQKIFPGVRLEEGSVPNFAALNQALVGSKVGEPEESQGSFFRVNDIISTTFNTRVNGQSVVAARSFFVSGVLAPFGQGFFVNPDETIFINTLAGQSLIRQRTFSGIFVVTESRNDVELVTARLNDQFGGGLRITASSAFLDSIRSVNQGISTILTSVAFMAVLVAFLGIMTTMFTAVSERTKEIGILKSLGFKKKDIMGMFLAESTLAGLFGGLGGIVLGVALSFIVVGAFGGNLGIGGGGGRGFGGSSAASAVSLQITPIITAELLIGTLILAVVIGTLAGVLPAWRASKMIPVEALKHE